MIVSRSERRWWVRQSDMGQTSGSSSMRTTPRRLHITRGPPVRVLRAQHEPLFQRYRSTPDRPPDETYSHPSHLHAHGYHQSAAPRAIYGDLLTVGDGLHNRRDGFSSHQLQQTVLQPASDLPSMPNGPHHTGASHHGFYSDFHPFPQYQNAQHAPVFQGHHSTPDRPPDENYSHPSRSHLHGGASSQQPSEDTASPMDNLFRLERHRLSGSDPASDLPVTCFTTSSPIWPGHTENTSPHPQHEPVSSVHRSSSVSPQDENSSLTIHLHSPEATGEPHTLNGLEISAWMLDHQRHRTLILNIHRDLPHDAFNIPHTDPRGPPDRYLQATDEKLQKIQEELMVLYTLPYVDTICIRYYLQEILHPAQNSPVGFQETLTMEIDIDKEVESLETLFALIEQIEVLKIYSMETSDIINFPCYAFDPSTRLSEQTQCVICLCDFEEQQLLRLLPCKHVFHTECVDRWIRANRTCPLCRADLNGTPSDSHRDD